jgi:hypothetical protein
VNISELFFILCALAFAIAVVRLVLKIVRRRWLEARRLGVRLAAATLGYLSVVAIASAATPRRWVNLGEEQRFDDWALTILTAERSPEGYRLTIRVANRGRGRAQSAPDADVLLVAADGRRFECRPAPGERSLRSVVQAGESFETVRVFDVPRDAALLGADVVHGAWPEWFIVGDRGSIFHRRPLVRLGSGG